MFRNILFVATSLLCLAMISSFFGSRASTTNNRYEITGSAQTRGEMRQNHFTGNAELKINGEDRRAVVAVNIVEPFTTIEGGNQIATATYRLDFENGDSVAASGKLNLVNTGSPELQNINSTLGINEGTGVFANTRGQLELQGNINLQNGEASWVIKGTIENQGGAQ